MIVSKFLQKLVVVHVDGKDDDTCASEVFRWATMLSKPKSAEDDGSGSGLTTTGPKVFSYLAQSAPLYKPNARPQMVHL